MAENNIEKRVGDVEARQAVQDAKFDAFMQEMRDFKIEMRNNMQDFKNEMRQQNDMRAAEIMELRQDLKNTSREIRGLLIAFVGIIIAIMVGMFWNPSSDKNVESASKSPKQATIETPIETAGR